MDVEVFYFNRERNFFSLFSSSISLSSSWVELNMFWSVGNLLRRFIAAAGPIPGNPSRINCFCSSGVLKVFDGLIDISCFGLSYFLAVRIRKFAVSSSFLVYTTGIW